MILGYKNFELLHENRSFKIFRAISVNEDSKVILKLPSEEAPTKQLLAKLKNEYHLGQQVDSTNVIKYISLFNYDADKFALIEEDIDGKALTQELPINGFSVEKFLAIATHITSGLQSIHKQGIIHKNIKPDNIIINEQGQVKIIDFNIANQVAQENYGTADINHYTNSLNYFSPELTGRINRNIDYRTDFYSLGVTFYQILTGQLPFTGDARSIVHQHIATKPIEPHYINNKIPLPISALIMKLLAKNPEERYQSSVGILHDLKELSQRITMDNDLSTFQLAEQDFAEKFIIPQKLYGREAEINALMKIFEQVSLGQSGMLMVTGYAGIGKTALINEIQKPLTLKTGYFISGKFDQLSKGTAYYAIIQAFQKLMKQLLTENEQRFSYWKEKLEKALGPNGQLIIDVIPEVERIIGPQPPVEILEATETRNRFNIVFKKFIYVFTQKDHPLILFLDDLQWADFASLELIKLFMSDVENFLLIGAYRDNEVDELHPTMLAIDELRKAKVLIKDVALAPLSLSHVEQWIADTLNCSLAAVRLLAEVINRKTQGNPFFTKMFLQALYDEGIFTRAFNQSWQWDLQSIQKRPATANVVEFMVSCIHQLPKKQTKQLLMLASCFGHQVAFYLLEITSKNNIDEILQDLQPAFNMGMASHDGEIFYFAHDRVQEAAYLLLDEDEKKQKHLLIGRLLLKDNMMQIQPSIIFEIVNHFNQSSELVADNNERILLTKLNLEAGKKAKNAIAYQTALKYLNKSAYYLSGNDTNDLALADEYIWANNYSLAFTLYKEMIEVEYLNGNFEKASQYADYLFRFIIDPVDLAEINILLLIQKTMQGQYREAINIGRSSLNQLQADIDEVDLKSAVITAFDNVEANLSNSPIESILSLPDMQDHEKIVAIKVLFHLTAPAFLIDPNIYFLVGLKMVELSLQFGHTPEGCMGFSIYAALLCQRLYNQKGYEVVHLALNLSEKFNRPREKCRVISGLALLIHHWSKPLPLVKEIAKEGYEICAESGELQFAGYISYGIMLHSIYQGNLLVDIVLQTRKYLDAAKKAKNQAAFEVLTAMQLTIVTLANPVFQEINKGNNLIEHLDFEVSCIERKNFFPLCVYHTLKAQLLYLMDDYTSAHNSILEAKKNISSMTGFISTAMYNIYQSLILVKLYSNQTPAEQNQILLQLEINQGILFNWSNSCSENFLHHYKLIEAEIARIKNNAWQALKLYNEAIKLAKQNKFIQDEALANLLAAQFYQENDEEKLAEIFIKEAHVLYKQWGATAKVRQLEEFYPKILGISANYRMIANINEDGHVNLAHLDIDTILKASQAISSEVNWKRFLQKMMLTIVEHAGAEKATFFTVDEEKITVMAQCEKQAVNLQSLALSEWQNGAASVVRYIKRIKQSLILTNASQDINFQIDSYIRDQQTKSLLCMPIIVKGILKAILYLENNLTSNAFTSQHIKILEILTNQISISLENISLYEAMQRSEKRYRTLAENTHAVIWLADEKICFVKPQDMWSQFTGQQWETYKNLGWLKAIHQDDQERVSTILTQSIAKKGAFQELIRVWSNSGYYKYLILCAIPFFNETGEIIEWLGTCLDIDALKQTEDRLQTLTNNLNMALTAANVGIWNFDLLTNRLEIDTNTFGLFDINPDTYQYTLEEILAVIHLSDKERVHNLLKNSIAEHMDYETEYRIVRKDKSIHHMFARGKVFYQDNIPVRLTGTVWDAQHEKEQQRLREAETYRQKLEEFIDTMCHELRNPLNGIYGAIDFLQDFILKIDSLLNQPADNNLIQAKEHLKTLKLCAGQQKAIVDDVLDLSKLMNGKMELTLRPFNIKTLIRDVIQMINPQIIQKKLSIEVHFPENDCLLKGDSYRLTQIVLNFLLNAVKFTIQGGITISSTINQLTSHTELSIVIKDTGIGMTEEEQGKLFERFSQAQLEKLRNYGGSGLGLVISKKLIEKMDGKIEVSSKKGVGSQFSFTIKCQTLTPDECLNYYKSDKISSSRDNVLIESSTITILIVEDNIVNQKVLARYLEAKKYIYKIATDGKQAVEKYQEFNFDLIFMDIEMPVMNGLKAAEEIRRIEKNSDFNHHIPIIGLSANAREEQKKLALTAGMDDYLTKPVHKDEIYKKIEEFVINKNAAKLPAADEVIVSPAADSSGDDLSPTLRMNG